MAAELIQDMVPRPVFLQFLEFAGEQEDLLFKKEITKKSWAKDDIAGGPRNPPEGDHIDRKVAPPQPDAKNKAQPRRREKRKTAPVLERTKSLLFLSKEGRLT